jgi:hypothetical protein
MRWLTIGLGLSGVLCFGATANASPITWVTGGIISRSTLGQVTVGDTFEMTVTFDDGSTDTNSTADLGNFQTANSSPYGFRFVTSTYSASSDGAVTTIVQNRDPIFGVSMGQDIYSLNNFSSGSSMLFSLNFQQEVQDQVPPDLTMLTSDSLLTLPPQFFGSDTFASFSVGTGRVTARPTFAYRVPEPGLAGLLFTGLLCLGALPTYRKIRSVRAVAVTRRA